MNLLAININIIIDDIHDNEILEEIKKDLDVSDIKIPEVKPVVIVNGINLIRLPNLQTPIIMSIIPAISVAITSPEKPLVAIIPATIEANAAVGPAICIRLPPKRETQKPAAIAV